MTVLEAQQILAEIEIAIRLLEDETVVVWEKYYAIHDPICACAGLTERYTCREVLKSWIARNSKEPNEQI